MKFDLRQPLVIGTHNRKKGAELAELLEPLGFRVATLDDFLDAIDVPEVGETFAANSVLKAVQQAKHLGHWVLADDSGLEVGILGGTPGVFSARYHQLPKDSATDDASAPSCEPTSGLPNSSRQSDSVDEANNRRLLEDLAGTPLEKRSARYICHVAVADPTGAVRAESEDVCRGRIRFEPAGTNGFGYDPLFEVVEYHRTFGELGPLVKQALSHRSRALRAIVPKLWALSN